MLYKDAGTEVDVPHFDRDLAEVQILAAVICRGTALDTPVTAPFDKGVIAQIEKSDSLGES